MSLVKLFTVAVAAFLALCAAANANDQQRADAYFADGAWDRAATAYEALLEDDPDNAANWFSLGVARRNAGDHAGAVEALQKAIETGYQPEARARVALARALAAAGDTDAALTQLERVAELGGPNHRVLLGMAEFESLAKEPRFQAVIATLTPCNTDEYRAFDFWLGEWDVTIAPAETPAATNNISSVQGGCVVLEQYTNGAFTGMSLNFYDSTTEKWHQTWMSNNGGSVFLEGGLTEDGAMQMTDRDLPISAVTQAINRVTWTPNEDGSVRQYWENSSDGGESWTVIFDGLYRKRAE